MANDAIGADHYELMIRTEAGIEPPLAAEGAGAGPGKQSGQSQEECAGSDSPTGERPFPESALPQDGVRNCNQRNAPASAPVHFFRGFSISLGKEERQ